MFNILFQIRDQISPVAKSLDLSGFLVNEVASADFKRLPAIGIWVNERQSLYLTAFVRVIDVKIGIHVKPLARLCPYEPPFINTFCVEVFHTARNRNTRASINVLAQKTKRK